MEQVSAGFSITGLAEAYHRSWATIAAVVHGRTYRQVQDIPDVPPLPVEPGSLAASMGHLTRSQP